MVTTAWRVARSQIRIELESLIGCVVSRAVRAGQSLAVGTESHTVGGLLRGPFQRDQPARGQVPDQDRRIPTPTSRGEMGTVGTEDRSFHLVGGAVEREAKWLSGRRIPELHIVGQPLAGNVVPWTAPTRT